MYRAAVIGLGWMGLLYDLASRIGDRFAIADIDRPTPPLDIHRRFHHYDHPGDEGNPTSYAEALWDRPEVETVIAADRDPKRLKAYGERYGIEALYEDAEAMLQKERPAIVAVCTNTKYRAHFTCLAVECGAKGIGHRKANGAYARGSGPDGGCLRRSGGALVLRGDYHDPSFVLRGLRRCLPKE